MTLNGLLQIAIYAALVVLITPFLGGYMAKFFEGERVFLTPVVRPVERVIYRLAGVDEEREMDWKMYLAMSLVFSLVGLLISYIVMRTQNYLPLNPDHQAAVPGYLAFNTAVSFTTNTNWQNYGGETTMSYLSQMFALATHNYMSAAFGIALAIALVRGLARRSASTLGNFWVDITRATLYLLLPICIVGTIVFVAQGMPQTLGGAVTVKTLEGGSQTISRGPVASQETIKDLGNNGGGFFNANAAHPFENPSPFTSLLINVGLLAIPFALTYTFGRMVGNVRQGWAVFGAMAFILLVGIFVASIAEETGNPAFTQLGISQASNGSAPGGNMEGKSVRFGPILSGMFAASTTGTSTGSVIASHDSFTPLGGLVPLVLIEMGEVTPGGIGAGLYGMLVFAIVAVFIAGLMVGRTPEYLGKKIQAYEVKMASLVILVGPAAILGFTAVSVVIPNGLSSILNPGPHGLTEVLYSFSSQFGNNGSAFAGLNGNTPYYNVMGGIEMFIGRFIFLIPIMALAGSLVRKPRVPESAGTFPTDTALFTGLLVGVVVIVAALTFFPALSLGPIVEHLRMSAGKLT